MNSWYKGISPNPAFADEVRRQQRCQFYQSEQSAFYWDEYNPCFCESKSLFVWLKHLQVRQILCHVVTLLIERISGIDWVPYLTTKYNSSMIGMIMIRGWSWLGLSGLSWLERSCGCWSSMSRLVDDVASHVRLFKSARYKYKCPLKVKLQLTNCKHWISKRPNQKYQ